MKIEAPELSWLLGVANDLRTLKGDETLEDLPDSYTNEPAACLVANAFNYGCHVQPMIPDHDETRPNGYIGFKTERDRNLYCQVTNTKPIENSGIWLFEAHLTPELNEIATNFDRGLYEAYQVQY